MDNKAISVLKRNNDTGIVNNCEYDLFVLFALYLNKIHGFKTLSIFIENTKQFQTQLNVLLNKYYKHLDFENYDKENMVLFELLELVSNYQITLMEQSSEHYIRKFNTYFKNIKKNTHDLDPCNSYNKIISNLQIEWTIRMYRLESYYNKVVERNEEKLNTEHYLKNPLIYIIERSIGYVPFLNRKSYNNSIVII